MPSCDFGCFGILFSILCFFSFANSVVGPGFVVIESTLDLSLSGTCDGDGVSEMRGPLYVLQLNDKWTDDRRNYAFACQTECNGPCECLSECFYQDKITLSDFDYKRIEFDGGEAFTGQILVLVFGGIATILTLLSFLGFCKMTCTTEGLSESKCKVVSTFCLLAGVCGAVNIVVWNLVSVPDIEEQLSSRSDIVFNEQCFSQILLIAAIVFSLLNACLAVAKRERDWDV